VLPQVLIHSIFPFVVRAKIKKQFDKMANQTIYSFSFLPQEQFLHALGFVEQLSSLTGAST
jgi:hypothetical protein